MRRIAISAAASCGGASLLRAYANEPTGSDIGVATYNVLSPSLARANYFTKCDPEDLDPDTRLARVVEKVETLITDGHGVICLQEVGLSWSGPLQVALSKKGYNVAFTSYGSFFSNYMGCALAWDAAKYDLEMAQLVRVSDTFKDWPSVEKESTATQLWNWVTRAKPERNVWREAKDRKNQAIFAKLREKEGARRAFVVGNYHMPCLFGSHKNVQVVNIHTQLLAKKLEALAGSDPYILLGDFNFQPDSTPYHLLHSGALPAGHLDTPVHPQGDKKWTVGVQPLRSAYHNRLGAEPVYTNLAAPNGDRFVGTLDYIWLSPHWQVREVGALPPQAPEQVYPTAAEPSDHLALSAKLVL